MNQTLGTETVPVPVETRGLVDFPKAICISIPENQK